MTKDYPIEISYRRSSELNRVAFILLFFIINVVILTLNGTGDISITLSFFTNLLFIIVFSSLG